ncbi:hypothetical protein AB0758_46510 [Tolypothrix bouteillei VB521301_2]|uniref:hypothetical protein n=1 Tax=Tolypothrix bouteillei TaxID=1246981 RepID=UPI0038B564D3
MTKILQEFPQLQPLLQEADRTKEKLDNLIPIFKSLMNEQALTDKFLVQLGQGIDISQISNTIKLIKNAIPTQNFLWDSEVTQNVEEIRNIYKRLVDSQEESIFDSFLTKFTKSLSGLESIEKLKSRWTLVEKINTVSLSSDNDFLPFITQNLLGLSEDTLQKLENIRTTDIVLCDFEPEVLFSRICQDIESTIKQLEPTNAEQHTLIQNRLQEVKKYLSTKLEPLDKLTSLCQSNTENTFYTTFLSSINCENVFSLDKVIASTLDDILQRIEETFNIDSLTQRLENYSVSIHESLTQIKQQIQEKISEINQKISQFINGIHFDEIEDTLKKLLVQIQQQIGNSNITQIITNNLEGSISQLDELIANHFDKPLKYRVEEVISTISEQVKTLQNDNLTSEVKKIVQQVEHLFLKVENELQGDIEQLQSKFLEPLGEFSFQLVSNEIITEINEIKVKLQSINLNALSDQERNILKSALESLKITDLSPVVNEFKQWYEDAEGQVKSLLSKIKEALHQLQQKLEELNPEKLLKPVSDVLNQLLGLVNGVNGKVIFEQFSQQLVDESVKRLEATLNSIFDPLQAPYNEMMEVVNRLDDANKWAAPLHTMCEQIDKLLSDLDVTPILQNLKQCQQQFLDQVHKTIFHPLNNLKLPEPLNTFFKELDTRSLCQHLDAIFEQVMQQVKSIPKDTLTNKINTVRQIFADISRLNPRNIVNHWREREKKLTSYLKEMRDKLVQFKQKFSAQLTATSLEEVLKQSESILANFDDMIAFLDTNISLLESLKQITDYLDVSAASEAYTDLQNKLNSLLPNFLRQQESLSYEDIITGIWTMRPSVTMGEEIDRILISFKQRLQQKKIDLQQIFNNVSTKIFKSVMPFDLYSVDEFDEIKQLIQEKIKSFDRLISNTSNSVNENLLYPIKQHLTDINPADIKPKVKVVADKVVKSMHQSIDENFTKIEKYLSEHFKLICEEINKFKEQVKATMEIVLTSPKNLLQKRVERQ